MEQKFDRVSFRVTMEHFPPDLLEKLKKKYFLKLIIQEFDPKPHFHGIAHPKSYKAFKEMMSKFFHRKGGETGNGIYSTHLIEDEEEYGGAIRYTCKGDSLDPEDKDSANRADPVIIFNIGLDVAREHQQYCDIRADINSQRKSHSKKSLKRKSEAVPECERVLKHVKTKLGACIDGMALGQEILRFYVDDQKLPPNQWKMGQLIHYCMVKNNDENPTISQSDLFRRLYPGLMY